MTTRFPPPFSPLTFPLRYWVVIYKSIEKSLTKTGWCDHDCCSNVCRTEKKSFLNSRWWTLLFLKDCGGSKKTNKLLATKNSRSASEVCCFLSTVASTNNLVFIIITSSTTECTLPLQGDAFIGLSSSPSSPFAILIDPVRFERCSSLPPRWERQEQTTYFSRHSSSLTTDHSANYCVG